MKITTREITPPPPPAKVVVIELTEEEAQQLGRIHGQMSTHGGPHGNLSAELYRQLDAVAPYERYGNNRHIKLFQVTPNFVRNV